jgi:hypothetical protein
MIIYDYNMPIYINRVQEWLNAPSSSVKYEANYRLTHQPYLVNMEPNYAGQSY